MTRIALFLVVAIGGFWTTESRADVLKVCFNVDAFFSDCGRTLRDGTTTEHYLGSGGCEAGVPMKAYGANVQVRQTSSSGQLLFSGNVGDGLGTGDPGAGCTTPFYVPSNNSTFYLRVNSHGNVQSNPVEAVQANGSTVFVWGTRTLTGQGDDALLTAHFSSTNEDYMPIWSAFLGASFALYRHAGNMTGKMYRLRVDRDEDGNHVEFGEARLNYSGAQRKFTLVHEMGHLIAHHGGFLTGSCSTVNHGSWNQCAAHQQNASPPPLTPARHSMGSMESQECAFTEGFAHFYAADVWNHHGSRRCSFGYYKRDVMIQNFCNSPSQCPSGSSCYNFKCYSRPVVDCQPGEVACGGSDECTQPPRFGSTRGYEYRHMADYCDGPFDNRGVEVDWLRTFWTAHTRGTSPPTFNDIRAWLSSAYGPLGFGTPYERLDFEANQAGGSLNSNWDFAKSKWGLNP